MDQEALKQLLQQVQSGQLDIDGAVEGLKNLPFESMDFATLDHHRALRCGFPEVIYCPGKTVEQVRVIFGRLAEVEKELGPFSIHRRIEMERQAPLSGKGLHMSPGNSRYVLDDHRRVGGLRQKSVVIRIGDDAN